MSQFIEDKPEQPHCFIQWKGTDVCMDFHCDCGEHNHYDGMFAYVIRCGKCGKEWEMPCYVSPRPNQREGWSVMEPQS